MLITKLEEIEKGKVRVYIDDEYQFLLYSKEIQRYRLKENEVMPEQIFQAIIDNTVLRRAKQKALAILKYMDRTEQELTNKLKQAQYNDTVISEVIDYIKQYHYIDDTRYASNYIRFRKNNKSKRMLQAELLQKGIEKDVIEQVLEVEYNDEDSAIQKAIAKKSKNVSDMSKEEIVKLSSNLYRKGYSMDLIRKYLMNGDYD